MSISHVLLSEASTHNPLDVRTELGVEEANDVGIDGAVEHERPQRHLDPHTQLLLTRLGLLKHSKTSLTATVMFSAAVLNNYKNKIDNLCRL